MDEEERDVAMTPQPDPSDENEAAPAAEGATPAEPATDLAEAYEKAVAESKDLYDRLLRKQAELDNFRKRTLKEKEDLRQYAAEDLIRSLLPALDGFERALQHRDESVPASFYQGLELIYRELREVLGRAGLEPVATEDQLFDPYLHQAVETVKAPGRREHEIVEELQRGYRLKKKLLRPSIVKVAVGGEGEKGKTD
ncbi:MAG: nucleotide exchange factor GrpE [Terriglobia bacterium]